MYKQILAVKWEVADTPINVVIAACWVFPWSKSIQDYRRKEFKKWQNQKLEFV